MDPTTGALGYGIEYGYSVMERLRLAALRRRRMTRSSPCWSQPGDEAWRPKRLARRRGRAGEWGDWKERAIIWETLHGVFAPRNRRRHPGAAPPRDRPAWRRVIDKLMAA